MPENKSSGEIDTKVLFGSHRYLVSERKEACCFCRLRVSCDYTGLSLSQPSGAGNEECVSSPNVSQLHPPCRLMVGSELLSPLQESPAISSVWGQPLLWEAEVWWIRQNGSLASWCPEVFVPPVRGRALWTGCPEHMSGPAVCAVKLTTLPGREEPSMLSFKVPLRLMV